MTIAKSPGDSSSKIAILSSHSGMLSLAYFASAMWPDFLQLIFFHLAKFAVPISNRAFGETALPDGRTQSNMEHSATVDQSLDPVVVAVSPLLIRAYHGISHFWFGGAGFRVASLKLGCYALHLRKAFWLFHDLGKIIRLTFELHEYGNQFGGMITAPLTPFFAAIRLSVGFGVAAAVAVMVRLLGSSSFPTPRVDFARTMI